MTQILVSSGIPVNTSFVLEEIVRNSNSTSNRTTSINLLHHRLFTRHRTILIHIVLSVVLHSMARGIMTTITADIEVSTFIIGSSVTHTSFRGNTILLHIVECLKRMTTMATSSRVDTVYKNLRRELLGRPGSLSHQTKTIRNSRGRGKCPARSAILRNMLVLGHRDIRNTIKVTTRFRKNKALLTDRNSLVTRHWSCIPMVEETSQTFQP